MTVKYVISLSPPPLPTPIPPPPPPPPPPPTSSLSPQVRTLIQQNLDEYGEKLKSAKELGEITKSDYTWVLSLILNAIVIHAISPRPGLLQGITIGVAKEAVSGGLCASSSFKTSATYLLQVLALDYGCKKLLTDYLEVWRPLIEQTSPIDTDPLFLNSNGFLSLPPSLSLPSLSLLSHHPSLPSLSLPRFSLPSLPSPLPPLPSPLYDLSTYRSITKCDPLPPSPRYNSE